MPLLVGTGFGLLYWIWLSDFSSCNMLFLLPTDTCYWLAGSFTREDYEAIYRVKWRDFSKQLALLVGDFDDMWKYVEISDEQLAFLRVYPHPWSFLGKQKESFILPEWMDHEKYRMISIRVAKICLPNDKLWMMNAEYPLFLTSANLSGASESNTLEQAQKIFPWLTWVDSWICDRPPSNIFSIGADGRLEYLRKNY